MISSDLKLLVEYQQKAAKLQRSFSGASQLTTELKNRLAVIKQALYKTSFPVDYLVIRSLSIKKRLNDIITRFRGDQTIRFRYENSPWSIGDRVSKAIDDLSGSTSRPTKTVQDAFKIASEEFSDELRKLKEIVEVVLLIEFQNILLIDIIHYDKFQTN